MFSYIFTRIKTFILKKTDVFPKMRRVCLRHTTSSWPSKFSFESKRRARRIPSAASNSQNPKPLGVPSLGSSALFQLFTGPQIYKYLFSQNEPYKITINQIERAFNLTLRSERRKSLSTVEGILPTYTVVWGFSTRGTGAIGLSAGVTIGGVGPNRIPGIGGLATKGIGRGAKPGRIIPGYWIGIRATPASKEKRTMQIHQKNVHLT
jgi:hypothetical protein